ncbi:MAG TPA: DNA mismatch repair protein MutS, partial [Neisseriales bacterium]|nr:DNA mismatch repair protein MutS [Neisseriales bacterium]
TEYFRFGQRNLPKELRSGKYPIRAVLDLHNYTKAHALNILERFLENAQPSVCLKIIHGIGLNSANNEPVLLGTVRKYLEQHPQVLAYSYGAPQQGGMGITLVKIVST